MKNIYILLLLAGLFSFNPSHNAVFAQSTDSIYVIQGHILGGDTREPLPYASIAVRNMNLSSIANQDGYFSLRVPASVRNSHLVIRHLGYENKIMATASLLNTSKNNIFLNPRSIRLEELQVISGDGRSLVQEALRRIPQNYPKAPNMMVAFYRESIKKGSGYITLVEAVLDIYKASYQSYNTDQAKIYIGRKATDISPRDTVMVKFVGGINGALLLDIAKYPEYVFDENGDYYDYAINGLTHINDKLHYVISFVPRFSEEILYRGKIYLEAQSLAFARMEFNMNVENRKDASSIFILRKPPKMRAEVTHARYIVDFTETDGKWYFSYSNTDVSFKVRWTNRLFGLFATNYTISSEIAITDRYEDNIKKFPRKERIHSADVIAEKVEYFQDPDFWGEYNIIEPDKEISNAIKKLSGKLLRRSERSD